jgi:hypothetical protein
LWSGGRLTEIEECKFTRHTKTKKNYWVHKIAHITSLINNKCGMEQNAGTEMAEIYLLNICECRCEN